MVVKGKQLTLKEQWQKFLDELKPMTPKQRVEHLWEYYKWVLGVLAMLVFVGAVVVTSIINLNTEVLASGVLINCDVDMDGYAYLSDGYFEKCGGEKGKQRVDLAYRVYEDYQTAEDTAYNYDVYQSIFAMIAASGLDYLVMDQVALEAFMDPDLLMDLREIFTEEELAAMGDKVIRLVVEETGETIPVALDISDSEFHTTYMAEKKEGPYMAFAVTSPRKETCRDMWAYINTLYKPVEE